MPSYRIRCTIHPRQQFWNFYEKHNVIQNKTYSVNYLLENVILQIWFFIIQNEIGLHIEF